MSRTGEFSGVDLSDLIQVKKVSGVRIKDARCHRGIKQRELAAASRISIRVLRAIETGNSGTHIDDHLKVSLELELPVGLLLFSPLFVAHGMPVPGYLLHADTISLERACVDLIARATLKTLTDELTPSWWVDGEKA
jgi:transcriptional regulator with XRE-family HTH domain